MNFLIITTSLNSNSRSRIMAHYLTESIAGNGNSVKTIDMRDYPLPLCDGQSAYGDANVKELQGLAEASSGIIVATPIYNYTINAVAKNLIELTGRAWSNKPVGFICAAGGKNSYMAVMGLANSLMLDFRCLVIPRFVYSTDDAFEGDVIKDADLKTRIQDLGTTLVKFADISH